MLIRSVMTLTRKNRLKENKTKKTRKNWLKVKLNSIEIVKIIYKKWKRKKNKMKLN